MLSLRRPSSATISIRRLSKVGPPSWPLAITLDDEAARLLGNVLHWQTRIWRCRVRGSKPLTASGQEGEARSTVSASMKPRAYMPSCAASTKSSRIARSAMMRSSFNIGSSQSVGASLTRNQAWFRAGVHARGPKAFAETTSVHLKECLSRWLSHHGRGLRFCRLQQEVHRTLWGRRKLSVPGTRRICRG